MAHILPCAHVKLAIISLREKTADSLIFSKFFFTEIICVLAFQSQDLLLNRFGGNSMEIVSIG